VLLLTSCQSLCGSSQSDRSKKPVDVASIVAGCRSVEECNQECSSGKPVACVSAGRLYEYGHGVVPDPAHAYQLYDQACALGYSGGCYNAAILLESGRGVSRDLRRAHQLYARVCQMGSKTACERAEALGDGGEG